MQITIIAAVAQNRAIGKDNKLIYWLPNDHRTHNNNGTKDL